MRNLRLIYCKIRQLRVLAALTDAAVSKPKCIIAEWLRCQGYLMRCRRWRGPCRIAAPGARDARLNVVWGAGRGGVQAGTKDLYRK
jgi:hypothetical protein